MWGVSVMSKLDEYRAHAAECQRKAAASIWEDDKRQWLSLAQSWLGLIHTRERPEVEGLERRLGEHHHA
jgi:hypothetical protein